MKKADMKQEESPSQLINKRIVELGDLRGVNTPPGASLLKKQIELPPTMDVL